MIIIKTPRTVLLEAAHLGEGLSVVDAFATAGTKLEASLKSKTAIRKAIQNGALKINDVQVKSEHDRIVVIENQTYWLQDNG
jgi:hypothetical protein